MSASFSITTEIHASPDRVFAIMSDTERWHEWTPSVSSIRRLDNGAFVVGSRAVIRQPKFPPALWKITAIDGKSFTWVSGAPGMRVIAHHSVEPTAAGSRVTLALRYEGMLGRLMARLTGGITERYLALEANGLKAAARIPRFVTVDFSAEP